MGYLKLADYRWKYFPRKAWSEVCIKWAQLHRLQQRCLVSYSAEKASFRCKYLTMSTEAVAFVGFHFFFSSQISSCPFP